MIFCLTDVLDNQYRDPQSIEAGAVISALKTDPLFCLGAQPIAFSKPRLTYCNADSKESEFSFDNAFEDEIRADITVCIFLNDPAEYDGGELIIETDGGYERFKPEAGTCIVFPSPFLRRFEKITRGHRWTFEVKTQSRIRNPVERQILYDIGCAGHFIETFASPDTEDAKSLRGCREQLSRLWDQP